MKRFGIIAMLLVLLTACQEEISFNKVQEGVPAKLGLTISLTSSEKIQTRGIKDYESEISELMLIMYEANNRKMVVDLTGNLVAGAADGAYGGHRTYTTKNDVTTDIDGTPILSGTYRVYAIANWSSPFCELEQSEILAMSEEELNSAVGTNSGFVYNLTGDQKFPMTGYTEGIEIKPFETDGATQITGIKLRRMISHIEFIFVNGKDNLSFVPKSYTIYNIPSGAYLMDNRSTSGSTESSANKYNGTYSHSKSIDIVSGGEIAFFMQENVQGPAANVNAYADRDKWEGTREDGTKDFINAPENATYVTVTGEYEDDTYTGVVSYTIHLGKFGKASDASRAYNNFEVCRNEYHTYTITVNGVSSIKTEAEADEDDGGKNPGAEGTITQTNKGSQFVLDAHYETVMLSFDLSTLCDNANLIIETPYQGIKKFDLIGSDGNPVDISSIDASWIHFMAPADTTSLPKYDSDKCINVAELAWELKAARSNTTVEDKHYITSTGRSGQTRVHVVAFVDEYFYETEPGTSTRAEWTDFVNKDNRTMILNPEENPSLDGNSILYPDYIFQVSQRSIKTTYGTASSTVNAFGIETWNETGRVEWGTANSESDLHDYDGYANTEKIMGSSWLSSSELATAGYITSVSSNTKEAHIFYDSDEIGMSDINGYNACLTRNRDEDGDGTIDAGELKWYMPAVFQFTALWMGLDYLQEDTQLFDPATTITESAQLEEYNYYTSSSNSAKKAEYWPVEGASYGARKHTNAVRCVRNLYDTDGNGEYDDVNPTVTINKSETRTITVTGASESSLRKTNMSGEYAAGHNERSQDNRLPLAFEVAESDLFISEDDLGGNTVEFELEDLGIVRFGIVSASATFSNSNLSGNVLFAEIEDGYTYALKGGSPITSNYLSFNQNAGEPWIALTVSKDGVDDNIALWFNFSGGTFTNVITVYKMLDDEEYEYGSTNNWGLGTTRESLATITVSSDATSQGSFSKTALYSNTTGLCSSHYSQEADKSDLGQWRVPNQRELMLMAEWGYISTASTSAPYASRTFFTYYNEFAENPKDEPFSYNGYITLQAGNNIGDVDEFIIRCVRDATPSSEADLIDASFSNSGNSLF